MEEAFIRGSDIEFLTPFTKVDGCRMISSEESGATVDGTGGESILDEEVEGSSGEHVSAQFEASLDCPATQGGRSKLCLLGGAGGLLAGFLD